MPDDAPEGDDNLVEAITTSLMRVVNKIEQGRRTPRDYGCGISMTLVETEMCALIFRHDGITGSELSEQLGVTRSATSQVIAKLRAKGLVSETPSAEDAKRKRLHLSDRGLQAAQIAQEYWAFMGAALFGSASTPELEGYLEFIRRLEAYHSDVVRGWEQGRTSPP